MKPALKKLARQTYDAIHSKGRDFVPPVQSLMDIDFYKFTMIQFILMFYPDVRVKFKLILRDMNIKLWQTLYQNQEALRMAFDHVATLSMRKTDIYYLRGMDLYESYMFKEDFLSFMRTLSLKGADRGSEGTFEDTWPAVTMWELMALPIVSELYYRELMKDMSLEEIENLYTIADHKLQLCLLEIKNNPGVRFADFGQRRRHSFLWQKYVVGEAVRVLGPQFVGTSNAYLAFHYDLSPIGTNAHELPMVVTALADTPEAKRNAQYDVLKKWESVYGQGLRIMLPDTYGSKQFYENAPSWLTSWRGQRQDSGDPIIEGERYKSWLKEHGVDPKEKLTIYSDGLSVQSMIDIERHFRGEHLTSFGWGTLFTNNMKDVIPGNSAFRPFSMACKVISANGRPCVKLSNDVTKATGPKEAISEYLEIFGGEDRVTRQAIV